jgi:hypothetical protein
LGTISELVVDTTRAVANFSVVSLLVGGGDSHDIVEGSWEVQEEGFNSVSDLGFVFEEWEVSVDESDGFILDLDVVSDNNTDVFVDVGDDGDDGGEVFSGDGLLEGWELTSEEGGVVNEASEVVNNDGGVGFFKESLDSEEGGIDVDSDLWVATDFGNDIIDLVELSVVWEFEALEDEELHDFSDVMTGGDEVTILEGVLEGGELHVEGHKVGEEAGGKAVLGDVFNFGSDGVEEGSDESDSLSALSDGGGKAESEAANSSGEGFWVFLFAGNNNILSEELSLVEGN